ncbi:RB1-inducible coiled-coil protein 1-like isoform X3 [Ruditapes philippinarum]|uniref:RB1-inducible coiled-coil protein 1-like isoform X3 n=1 Tax=Ruditapes philippinarum TaxID=129788 RepID=UPI00295C18E2|nr:RB1-inducible coiled-coil protein 1-like isoform X3 [Ruditapes philippinarum]
MLYIFHVDTGTMMTFDMNLAMEKVINLQGVIARGCRISEDKQVLLISGGESLDPNAVVGKYHAGTDTNPIFLFSKSTIESAIPPSPSVNYGSDIDLQGQVEGSLLMPPAYETVVSRAQLALQFQDVDTEELKACERLIHDQHLQQQGWAAVVANLEDVTSELQNRSETFHETYKQYLEDRQSYRDLITSVTESLQLLSKIPVIPSLVRSCDVTPVDCSSSTEDLAKFSLFDWISSQDTNHTLHDMVEQCGKATEQLDEKVDESLKGEVDQMMKEVQNDGMKEVKGLEDRLYGLDQIISGARKIVQEQAELAQGFVQNQNRLSNIRDRSILPDLCSSHRNQLIEMMKNHSRLREIKKKCRMAKEELSVNLHTRLRWVMYVEKKICDVDGKLTIYLGNLRRLRKRLDILQQVQDSPKVYAQLMIEVVRRKQFSSKFLSWANSLAEDSSRLHAEELKRRDSFLRIIGHHFLQAMFHGFEDFPPAFATEAPEEFDGNLPDITADDIKQLKEAVPELSGVLSVPVEEDLFVALTNVQDPMVQWVDSSEPNLKVLTVPRKLSRARSDSDAVHEEHMQPYSIEGGSISLGDQFEECKVEEEDLVCKPRFDSLSPPDKEFLLPKSLSEELTLEMKKQEAALKKELCDVTDDSKRKEGNSNSTSTTPIPSLPTVKHRVSRKSLTDTSPDMETSQEFTTADFYFDESMPSSIESPPKSSTEMKVNQEQIILAEKQLNAKLQLQLKESNKKLSQNEKTLKALCEFVENKIPSLRDNVKDLKKEQKDHIQNVLVDMEDLRTNVIQMVQTYDKVVTENNEAMLDKLTAEKDKRSNELSELLELETKKAKDLQESLERLEEEMKEKELKVSELKEQESQFETKLEEVRNGLLSEIKELTQKYELEVEVEVDKARSESSVSISNLEKELADKTNVICEKESAIKTLEKEKIKLEENLMDKFQVEKEQICDILEIEYEQKLANAEKEHNEKVEMMKQSIVAELKEKHETETKQKLDDLKQSLMVEKEQAVEMTQSLMVTEHSKAADEIKQKLIDEKSAEMAKYSEEMESKYQDDVAKLSAEFNKEKELLFNELSALKNREYSHIESQTVNSVFNVSDNDAQTNSAPAQLDSQAQTNVTEQLTASMQTDPSDQTHLAIQTDTTDTKSSTMQTDKAEVNEHSGQTDVTQLYDMSVQTEICDTGCEKTTCDTPDKMASVSDDKSETPSNGNAEEKVGSDNHNTTIEEMKNALQAEYDQKLAKMEEDHNAEISKLIALIEKEKEDAQQLKSSLTSMTGDKQTKFNEAVNRVSKEKDRVIEELRIKESKVVEDIKKLKGQIETLKEEKSKAEDIKERALSFLKDKEANQRLLESELGLAQQQVIQYKEQLQNLAPDSSDITVTKSSSSVVKISDPEEPALHQRIKDLEDGMACCDMDV